MRYCFGSANEVDDGHSMVDVGIVLFGDGQKRIFSCVFYVVFQLCDVFSMLAYICSPSRENFTNAVGEL